MSRPSRSAVKSDSFSRPEPTTEDEEGFEDVGLNDEGKQPPKRRSIFARFGDNSEAPSTGDAPRLRVIEASIFQGESVGRVSAKVPS